MGRRSRKRAGAAATERIRVPAPPARSAPTPARSRRARSGRGDPPPAPWGSFPLAELCILLALILGVAGFFIWGRRGEIMVICAAGLGSLAGLEISIREHLAGYRSHTTLLAGGSAMLAIAAMFFAALPRVVLLALGVGVFVGAFLALREVFKRRSGGLGFR